MPVTVAETRGRTPAVYAPGGAAHPARESSDPSGIIALTRELCGHATGVVADDNPRFFARLSQEVSLRLHRYLSGSTFNGWLVPDCWRVERATIHREGRLVFDGRGHPLAVGAYSKSFRGRMEWDALRLHLITNPGLPDAYIYHCCWQYRPWDADWAISIPHNDYASMGPGTYDVDLRTTQEPGEMIVADCEHRGELPQTIIFNAHTCHPGQANDDFAGVAVLIRLFQWLRSRQTKYTYRLVLGPEHLGTVFYLAGLPRKEVEHMVCGVFAEMPGTRETPLKVASSFLGGQPIDRAFASAARHHAGASCFVGWREGAGNDETVWEAPGYEVPFVEVSRCQSFVRPFPEYHSSLDTADALDGVATEEFLEVLKQVVLILEEDALPARRFDGLPCLSNPQLGLYLERPDPAVSKALRPDSEKWGHLLDSLLRYFDGSMSVLDIALKHDLPFAEVHAYVKRFRERGLVDLRSVPMPPRSVFRWSEAAEAKGAGGPR